MARVYKKWPDLTADQKAEATKMAQFIGYTPDELMSLLYGIVGDTVISFRDNDLLGNIFPAEPASYLKR